MPIADLRERIDALDERLVALLDERASIAAAIAAEKRAAGLPIEDPEREAQVIARASSFARVLPTHVVRELYCAIVAATRRFEEGAGT